MAQTTYDYTKDLPINFTVLQDQINADAAVGVTCDALGYDEPTLHVTMTDALTTAQKTALDSVVANHVGKTKGFQLGLPIPLFDDFVSGSIASALGWMSTTGNSGGVAVGGQADQDNPGICQLSTGVLPSGISSLHLGLADMILGSGRLQMEFRVQIPVLSAGLNTYTFRIGLGDQALADFNNGVYLEYNSAVSANWLAKGAAGGSRTPVSTGIVVGTGWKKFSFVVADDASSADCFVDNVFAATLTGNIPTLACGPIIQLMKTLGTTATKVNVDYFYLLKDTNRNDDL